MVYLKTKLPPITCRGDHVLTKNWVHQVKNEKKLNFFQLLIFSKKSRIFAENIKKYSKPRQRICRKQKIVIKGTKKFHIFRVLKYSVFSF